MIFFDLDDTLLDHSSAEGLAAKAFGERYQQRLPERSIPFIEQWRHLTDKHMKRFLAGELTFQAQRRHRIRELFDQTFNDDECDAYFQEFLNFYEGNWRLFDDVLPCLDALSHLRLGIITNGATTQQQEKLRRTGILNYFTIVMTAEDAKAAKPSAVIFEQACQASGASADACWHIGDHLEKDALGASAVGMKGIWLNRSKLRSALPEIKYCHTLKEFASFVLGDTKFRLNR